MTLTTLLAIHIAGYCLAAFCRGLYSPKPKDTSKVEDWQINNILFPLFWPLYLPFIVMWNLGDMVRKSKDD